MVDTMTAGCKLGDTAIASIGASSSLYLLLINFAEGLNNGYAIIVTQRFGEHEEDRFRKAVAGMIVLDGGGAVLLTALSLAFLRPLLHFLNLPEAIFAETYSRLYQLRYTE